MADDFDFSINRKGYVKTYPTPKKKALNKIRFENHDNVDDAVMGIRRPLTTKNAVRLLLNGTLISQVCRYCLTVTKPLLELDQIMQVASKGTLFKVTIRDMVASFYPIKVTDNHNFPNKICDQCLDSTMQAYLFTQQCEQSERALRNCYEDIYEKVEKLDPIETPKKRGKRKANPNHNIIYAEHKNVINYAQPIITLINTSSETLLPEDPVTNLECLKCSQVLPNIETLLNHEKQHPTSMWYSCRMCGKAFPKRYQLKRHFQTHSLNSKDTADNLKDTTNISFICKECGATYEKYTELLQHVEKHKFKVVMEHLLERKMNKLCSVCLTKSSGMVDLDKMICLHGGSPNVSGDRNLYSILASTLPDPQLYKYRELLIPREATIVKIIKKGDNQLQKGKDKSLTATKSSKPVTSKESEMNTEKELVYAKDTKFLNSNDEDVKDNLIGKMLNARHVTSNTKGEFKDDACIFFLSMPETLQNSSRVIVQEIDADNEIDSLTKETNMSRNDNDLDIEDNCINNSKPIIANKAKDSCIFLFSLPESVENITKTKDSKSNIANEPDVNSKKTIMLRNFSQISNNGTDHKLMNIVPKIQKVNTHNDQSPQQLCKTCWIFNKPSCKSCIEEDECNAGIYKIDVINSSTNIKKTDIQDSCKNCWLFKNVSNCGHCNKPNSNNNYQDYSSNTKEKIISNIDCNVTDSKNYKDSDFAKDKFAVTVKGIANNKLEQDKTKDKKENMNEKSLKRANEPDMWNCQMCLTANKKNFDKCHCCDSKRFRGDPVKFKFANQRFEFFSHNAKIKSEITYNNTKKFEEHNTKLEVEENVEKHEIPEKVLQNAIVENPKTNPELLKNSDQDSDLVPMDIEIIRTPLDNGNSNEIECKNIEKFGNTILIADEKKSNEIFRFGTDTDENLKNVNEKTYDNDTQYEAMDTVEDTTIIDNSHNNIAANNKFNFTPYSLGDNHSFGMVVNNGNKLKPKYEFNIGNSFINNEKKIIKPKRKLSRASR